MREVLRLVEDAVGMLGGDADYTEVVKIVEVDKYIEKPVEVVKVVEKIVEVPVEKPVVVEKIVEKPI